MKIEYSVIKYDLQFSFEAKTSRGALASKPSWFIGLKDTKSGYTGWGECSIIKGLSEDDTINYSKEIPALLAKLQFPGILNRQDVPVFVKKHIPEEMPAFIMALESALYDIISGDDFSPFPGVWRNGEGAIPINGLIWMGTIEFMLEQIHQKIEEGFNCLKLKVGSHDFLSEVELIKQIRKNYSTKNLTIRLDANGAFSSTDVYQKLDILSKLEIHSIEQPLKSRDPHLSSLCKNSPIDIALDEELIGIHSQNGKEKIIEIGAKYLILKPSLHGGFSGTSEWISLAESNGLGWWITSALESSVGLNAIAQFTHSHSPIVYQGLGTGKIYKNNIHSPVQMIGDKLIYNQKEKWKLPF